MTFWWSMVLVRRIQIHITVYLRKRWSYNGLMWLQGLYIPHPTAGCLLLLTNMFILLVMLPESPGAKLTCWRFCTQNAWLKKEVTRSDTHYCSHQRCLFWHCSVTTRESFSFKLCQDQDDDQEVILCITQGTLSQLLVNFFVKMTGLDGDRE